MTWLEDGGDLTEFVRSRVSRPPRPFDIRVRLSVRPFVRAFSLADATAKALALATPLTVRLARPERRCNPAPFPFHFPLALLSLEPSA